MVMCQKLLYRIQLPYTISFLRRMFERNIDEKYYVLIRVWHFGFETSRFWNFLIFFNGIGIGFRKFWYRKKYRYRFRKNLVSKKVSVSVSKIFGIEKSIGFEKFDIGFEKFWYRKKYQFLKILLKKQEILSKIYISYIWRCLFLPIQNSSKKY